MNSVVKMLLKLLTMKKDDVVELENNNRELCRKNNQLQMKVLAWKSHASKAYDQLLMENGKLTSNGQ